MSALASRLARQQEKLTFLNLPSVDLESKESAEAFKNLIQTSLEVTLASIHVLKAIRGSGWKVLVEGVRLHPGLRLDNFTVLKS